MLPVVSGRILLPLLLFCMALQKCHAANHYCANWLTDELQLDDFYHRDETIIHRVLNEPQENLLEPKSCKVKVSLKSRILTKQLVLMAVPSLDLPKPSAKMYFQFGKENPKHSVDKGMFEVLAVNQHSQFTVESSWNPTASNPSSENLRIVLPIPGECNRDMLGFNGSCYALSAVEQNATEALHSIRGDAQLASFSSMAEIRQLVAANSARLNRFPYEKPLRLGKPVRLGMFLNRDNASLLSIVRNESDCQLLPVLNTFELRQSRTKAGPCLSLRLNKSDGVELEADDCSTRMLSLVSFPQRARYPTRALCDGKELARQLEQLRSQWPNTSNIAHFNPAALTSNPSLTELIQVISDNKWLLIFAGVFIAILTAFLALFAWVSNRSTKKPGVPPGPESAALVMLLNEDGPFNCRRNQIETQC